MSSVPDVGPWTTKPLSPAARQTYFRQVTDLSAQRAMLGRSAIIQGWVLGGVGAACLLASAITVATLFPLKTTVIKFYTVDKSTGIIGVPVSLKDAPKTFGAAVERQYLRRYIEARAGWIPEMDRENDHVVKIMSSPDEQARYAASRTDPASAVNAVGNKGHVVVENFRYHPLALGADGLTRRYLVQYDRTVWHGNDKGPTVPWSATVDFQWLPWLPMLPSDRDINAGGFQAIAYSASSDTPDTRRQ